MSDDLAAELVKLMHGLFADLSDEQLNYWHQELLAYDHEPAMRAIRRLARESDLFRRPRLFELIHHEQPRTVAPARAADKADDEARKQFLMQVDLWIGQQSDDVLAKAKAELLEHEAGDIQAMFRNRDPRTSGWLKTQIYARAGRVAS